MKKRLLSFMLAFTLVLGLLPSSALASTPSIGFKDARLDLNSGSVNIYSGFMTGLYRPATTSHSIIFYYGTAESNSLMTDIQSVSSDNTAVVNISAAGTADTGETVYAVTAAELGSANIVVTTSSATYYLPVVLSLPSFGAYSTTTASAATLLKNSFTYTDSDKSFYLVLDNSTLTMSSVLTSNSDDLQYFNIDLSADGKYAKVDITNPAGLGTRYVSFVCDLVDQTGTYMGENSVMLRLVSGIPSVYYGRARWNNDVLTVDSGVFSYYDETIRSNPTLVFYYGTSENYSPITGITDVRAADPSIVSLEYEGDTAEGLPAYRVQSLKPGSTDIIIETASATYIMPFTATLWGSWFFTSPAYDPANAITSFEYNDTQDTFYIVPDNQKLLTDVSVESRFEDAFDVTLASDNSYAEVKIVDGSLLPGSDRSIGFEIETNYNGNIENDDLYIKVINNKPLAGFKYAQWDNGSVTTWSEFKSNLSEDLRSSPSIVFYYGTADNYSPITGIQSVAAADPSVVEISFWNNTDDGLPAYDVNFLKPGSTEIIITADSGTYSLPVSAEVRGTWFFSTPSYSDAAAISRFEYTDTQDTFYIVPESGVLLTDVSVENEFASNFDVTISGDQTYAEVRIVSGSSYFDGDRRVEFEIETYENGKAYNDSLYFLIINNKPSLGVKYARWDNGSVTVWSDFRQGMNESLRSSPAVVFYYGTINNHSVLTDIQSITAADPSVVEITFWNNTDDGLSAYDVNFLKTGSTDIIVTTSSGTYTLPVTIDLPNVWFFSSPSYRSSDAIKNFEYDGTEDTFYIVPEKGTLITSASPDSEYADAFSVEIASDQSYAEIKIANSTALPNSSRNIGFEIETIENGSTDNEMLWIEIANTMPVAGLRFARWNNDVVEPWSDFMSYVSDGIASSPAAIFYYGNADSYVPITGITSVSVADPDIAEVELWAETADGLPAYFLNWLKPGTTDLIVTTATDTYTIPLNINLTSPWIFSAPVFDANAAITSFTYDGSCDTFYVAAESGVHLDVVAVEEAFADAFVITISPDGSYAEVKIVDDRKLPANSDRDIRFHTEYSGSDSGDFDMWIPVISAMPHAGFRFAWYENGVLDARGDFQLSMTQRLGSTPFVPFYGTLLNNAPIQNVVSIESENPALFTLYGMGTLPSGGTVCHIDISDPYAEGTANVVVTTADGTVYKFPVTVLRPLTAAYDSVSSTNGVYEFTFTDTQREVYIKPVDSSMTLDGIEIPSSFENILSVELSADCTYAVIRLEDPTAFSSDMVHVSTQLLTDRHTEYSFFFLDLKNEVTPPQLADAPVAPSQYPAWKDQNDNGVYNSGDINDAHELTASVPLTNQSDETITVQAMLAVYDANDMMLGLRSGTLELAPGGSDVVSVTIDLSGLQGADHAKLFLVDGDFDPVSTVFELN